MNFQDSAHALTERSSPRASTLHYISETKRSKKDTTRLPKSKSYNFRLASYVISFRLVTDSNEELLFSDLLNSEPRNRGRITRVIDSVFCLAMKDILPENSKLTGDLKIRFWSSLKSQFRTNQEVMNQVFARAVETWNLLYLQGKKPRIFPKSKYVSPEKRPLEMEQMKRMIGKPVEEKTEITNSDSTEKVKLLFPESYRSTLIFYERDGACIVHLPYFDRDKWSEMWKIVKQNNGRYISQNKDSHFSIPLPQ